MSTDAMQNPAAQSFNISAFFTQQYKVDQALSDCLALGIPRDLIDVAVSEKAAAKFKLAKANRNTDHWFAWTGRGAFAGLIFSIVLSLAIVLIQGYSISNGLAFVQLLGPDIGIIVGAALGSIYGFLKESENNVLMQRAQERDDAMLFIVYFQPPAEAQKVHQILIENDCDSLVMNEATAMKLNR
jgi:hypothetical protein